MSRPRRILLAPNSYRDSLNAFQVAETIERGLLRADPSFETVRLPVADGGDHTAEVMLHARGGVYRTVGTLDPLERKAEAKLALTDEGTAVVELAEASGTRLLKKGELNPLWATTYGTGQLIKAALDEGCRKIIVGLGGSATVDGGVGLAQALGAKFLDAGGRQVSFGGGNLYEIAEIDVSEVDPRLAEAELIVACDVDNPLCGERGAAKSFAPQKGASPEEVKLLARNLRHLAAVIEKSFGVDVRDMPHAGAAGGAAASLHAVLGGKLANGSDLILEAMRFDERLAECDLVITAEGRADKETASGKAPFAVAKRAKAAGKPVIALCGQVPKQAETVFDAAFSIATGPMGLAESLKKAESLLERLAYQVGKTLTFGA